MSERPVALVTGGGTGIGFASAKGLAEAGCRLAIAGRRESVLGAAAEQIQRGVAGAIVDVLACDLGEPDAPQELVERTVGVAGSLEILVNAAATCTAVPVLDLTPENWDETVNVALRGAALCSVAAAHQMVDKGGRIIMITSVDERIAEPNVAHYSAAKAGLGAFARCLATDLGGRGIIANCVAPGWVKTPTAQPRLDKATPETLSRLNALSRSASPEEIADVVVFLALHAPTYLTGATVTVDGGQSIKAAMP
jgi:NAD(P)-dependent dehydrogenase (short-subunit alcohol dehydrogenase family)